jgi:hypothetical protein
MRRPGDSDGQDARLPSALYRCSRRSAKKQSPTSVQVMWKATNDYRISEALLLLGFTL